MNINNNNYDSIRKKNQLNYRRHHLRHHRIITFLRILVFIFFIGLWEFSSTYGLIDSFFFSSPHLIVSTVFHMFQTGEFFYHTGITLIETLVSFFFVFLFSLGSATILWCNKSIFELLDPYFVILNSLPKSALAPLFIVWLGTGIKTIIVAGISVALFGSILSLYSGFRQIEDEKIKLIYTLGGTKYHAFTKVVLPGSLSVILSNLKINIGLSLVGVIIGEFLAARRGLGYLIIYGSQVFQLNLVITSIVILCFIAMFLYCIIQRFEHAISKKQKHLSS